MAPDQVAAGSGYRRAADRRRRGDPGEAGEGGGHGGASGQGRGPGEAGPRAGRSDPAIERRAHLAGEPCPESRRRPEDGRDEVHRLGGQILGAPAGPGRAEEGAGDLLRGNRNTACEASGRRVAPGHVGDYEVCIFLSKADERVWMLKRNNHRNNGPAA